MVMEQIRVKISPCEDGLGSQLITSLVETNSIWWPRKLLLGPMCVQCKGGENPMHFVLFRHEDLSPVLINIFQKKKRLGRVCSGKID